jgi:hypothetical protein
MRWSGIQKRQLLPHAGCSGQRACQHPRLGHHQLPQSSSPSAPPSQVLLALEHLHTQGYIYCDLKPENLLVCHDGSLKVRLPTAVARLRMSASGATPQAAQPPRRVLKGGMDTLQCIHAWLAGSALPAGGLAWCAWGHQASVAVRPSSGSSLGRQSVQYTAGSSSNWLGAALLLAAPATPMRLAERRAARNSCLDATLLLAATASAVEAGLRRGWRPTFRYALWITRA